LEPLPSSVTEYRSFRAQTPPPSWTGARPTLDGVTLMRYAHIYRSQGVGGMENYLRQLDRALLTRYRMRIVQTYLSDTAERQVSEVQVEPYGRGEIVWIPIYRLGQQGHGSLLQRAKAFRPGRLVPQLRPGRTRASGKPTPLDVMRAAYECVRYADVIISDTAQKALDEERIDCLLLHWLSYDVGRLIHAARKKGIPVGIIHHFDNRRLERRRVRSWLRAAAGIAGVSARNVPPLLRPKFVSVSDAVDVSFFDSALARPLGRREEGLLLLPARIAYGKGHHDLLMSARDLSQKGVNISVAFAGAVDADAESLRADLLRDIAALDLRGRVSVLGQLTPDELRDWYGASDVVVLPSYYEGLGKVLLEAQAMDRPVVAYASGGIPDVVVNGRTGLLVNTGDRRALTSALEYLLTHPARRRSMGVAAREYVARNFSIAALLERHEQFYDELRKQTPRKQPCAAWCSSSPVVSD
jgi:glycosyltransferase involved in cell wall biosynthesis